MFGILMVGSKYDSKFVSKDGFVTENPEDAVKFEYRYWAINICHNWNKNRMYDEAVYTPIMFKDNGQYETI